MSMTHKTDKAETLASFKKKDTHTHTHTHTQESPLPGAARLCTEDPPPWSIKRHKRRSKSGPKLLASTPVSRNDEAVGERRPSNETFLYVYNVAKIAEPLSGGRFCQHPVHLICMATSRKKGVWNTPIRTSATQGRSRGKSAPNLLSSWVSSEMWFRQREKKPLSFAGDKVITFTSRSRIGNTVFCSLRTEVANTFRAHYSI